MAACARLAEDLRTVGVGPRVITHVLKLYDRALLVRAQTAWRHFYVAIFDGLHSVGNNGRIRSSRFQSAAKSLLLLLEDDLGNNLIETEDVVRLRSRLLEE